MSRMPPEEAARYRLDDCLGGTSATVHQVSLEINYLKSRTSFKILFNSSRIFGGALLLSTYLDLNPGPISHKSLTLTSIQITHPVFEFNDQFGNVKMLRSHS